MAVLCILSRTFIISLYIIVNFNKSLNKRAANELQIRNHLSEETFLKDKY